MVDQFPVLKLYPLFEHIGIVFKVFKTSLRFKAFPMV